MSGLKRDYRSLDAFLDRLQNDIYPEPPMEPHLSITRQMIDKLVALRLLAPGKKILDVGCGSGLALQIFREHGLQPVGVTLGPEATDCRNMGFDIRETDFSFMDLKEESFDLIWCRHALEHSPFPLFTIQQLHRLIKPEGLFYAEVPAPDTGSMHQSNPNHYSVLGKSMWIALFERSGLVIQWAADLNFNTVNGPDCYWSFLLKKMPLPSASQS